MLDQQGDEPIDRLVEVVVDENDIVAMGMVALPSGADQAAMDGRVVFRPPAAKPLLQLPEPGGVDEEEERRRRPLPDLQRPLDLDLEDDVQPLTQALDDRLDRGPVEVPGKLGEFEKARRIRACSRNSSLLTKK